jgi:hypothetical protein
LHTLHTVYPLKNQIGQKNKKTGTTRKKRLVPGFFSMELPTKPMGMHMQGMHR